VPHLQPRGVFHDSGITVGPIHACHGVKPHAFVADVYLQAESIVLDFMNPAVKPFRPLTRAPEMVDLRKHTTD